jgi:hypothetical protein
LRPISGRKAMKEKDLLLDSEHSVTRLQRLNLTDSQQPCCPLRPKPSPPISEHFS